MFFKTINFVCNKSNRKALDILHSIVTIYYRLVLPVVLALCLKNNIEKNPWGAQVITLMTLAFQLIISGKSLNNRSSRKWMSSFYPAPSLTFMLTGKIFFHKLEVVHEVVQNWTGSLAAGWVVHWPGSQGGSMDLGPCFLYILPGLLDSIWH